ncbi:protein YIPF1 [Ctenocephalides felis]|uniref:protein YIPF1 n=1 Tax=Ctenocephalides felis TaxID=7515 RepID=UPI000E6E4ADC|nr:protein YIPF1 [Ctenocephalides felis]
MSNPDRSNTFDNLLTFQEFSPVHNNYSSDGSAKIDVQQSQNFSQKDLSNDAMVDLMTDMKGSNLVADKPEGTPNTGSSFLSIQYYQQFFNVTTQEVVDRIIYSMVPIRAPPNYLQNSIEVKPDLYGPFWIQMTLIFTIAISGNLAHYLQNATTPERALKWHYDFHLVSYAATTIFCYCILIPIGLWTVFKWSTKPVDPDSLEEAKNVASPSVLSLLCIYGYSLAIYIPVSILWSIQVSILQWILLITATFFSGSVLVTVLLSSLKRTRHYLIILSVILTLHCILAAGFMLYFFHDPNKQVEIIDANKVVHPVDNTISP